MDDLNSKKERIRNIVNNLHRSNYYRHEITNPKNICESTISIVMTASNRSKQTYYTLNSINESSYKNVHVILVDDSTTDPINIEQLYTYPFMIDFISINRENKCWINPVVNYNIGFAYITGGYVIIQNAEVFHVGDILNYIHTNINDNRYYVFDVKTSNSYETNDELHKYKVHDTSIYDRHNLCSLWYQSAIYYNNQYHFLSAMTRDIFNTICSFSYDYCYADAYDDNDFVLKIKSLNIPIVSVDYTNSKCGGLHQYHVLASAWNLAGPTYRDVFHTKLDTYNKTGKYIDYYLQD